MLKILTAKTYEIDDVALAVEEVLEQLDLENNQLASSLGVMTCYSEFVDSGAVKAICEALPFEVVGCTTINNGIAGEAEMMMLSLSVLTADDVSFSCAVSTPVEADAESITDAYEKASAATKEPPKMVLTFMPLILELGGELMLRKLDQLSGGLPVFGTISSDHHPDYHTSGTIYNGECYHDCVVISLISGDIKPRFILSAITEKKLQKQRAIITESSDSVLMKVNNEPVLSFMRELGLTVGNGIEGMSAIPFLVDYGDGTPPVARAMYLVTDEGYIVCGGDMPVGATLAIGKIDVWETASSTMDAILAQEDIHGVLLFPCLSRMAVLGGDMNSEMNIMRDKLGDVAYHVAYSGGEVCPVYNEQGETANRFHNFSLVGCIL